MDNIELLYQETKKKYFSIKEIIVLAIISIGVIVLGIYVGNTLFGERSLENLIKLQNTKEYLENQIKSLQIENARLQKEHFELLGLEPKK